MTRHPRTSSSRRYSRAAAPRTRSALAGPLREVVCIFDREGVRGGPYWMLVLECGHVVGRTRHTAKSLTASIHLLLRPLKEKLAPKRVQCHYCGSGMEKHDPWILIKALGGDVP